MKSVPPSRYLVFSLLAVLGCLLDLGTKSWIFARLGMPGEQDVWWLWQGVFGFQTSLNEGALFGIGQGQVQFFAIMSLVAGVVICLWLFVAGAAKDWLVTVACGLIFAGILGNLYDRLGMPALVWNYANDLHAVGDHVYAVRDWLLVMIGSYHWPNFNLADSMLVCGAGLIIVQVVFFDKKPDAQPSNRAQKTESGSKSESD